MKWGKSVKTWFYFAFGRVILSLLGMNLKNRSCYARLETIFKPYATFQNCANETYLEYRKKSRRLVGDIGRPYTAILKTKQQRQKATTFVNLALRKTNGKHFMICVCTSVCVYKW